jgi:D-glycero-D-manno-heptose 1,7-bisphosphate phosphatase
VAESQQSLKSERAFFLDLDGVLVEDVDLLTDESQVHIIPGVVEALQAIHEHGYLSVVVTNQTVVARGLIDEAGLDVLHGYLRERLVQAGGPSVSAFYACPHHPHADVARYRVDCTCRKPKPGLLERASDDMGIDLSMSFMVGDRLSDVAAGKSAGCTTVLVESGAHRAPPIVGMPSDPPTPDHRFADLREAVHSLLRGPR